MKTRFDISGMSCAACQARVEKAVAVLDGVFDAQVNLLQKRLDVTYDEKKVSAAQLVSAVEKAGYGAAVHTGGGSVVPEEYALKKRFLLSLIFLIPLLWGHFFHLPALWQLVLTLPVVGLNRKFFTGGLRQLFKGDPNMDSLVALGAGTSVVFSVWEWMRGGQHLYFESATMILTLVTLGKWLEVSAKAKTTGALLQLVQLLPAEASVRRNGREVRLPLSEIKAGNEIVLRAGERIACDGLILSGTGTTDESALTGESLPCEKSAGSSVWAGTLLISGFITFRAEKIGRETSFGRLVTLVEDAAASKAPIARLADKVSAVFVPAVIAIALITFGVWYFSGASFDFALTCAVSVLVISCPCALGLATPTAITVGLGVGARHHILIKSAALLEELSRTGRVVFDKTGTLTTGKMNVSRVVPADGVRIDDLWRAALQAEYGSEHPFARAVVAQAKERQITCTAVQSFEQVPGLGVRAETENGTFWGGNAKAMQVWGVPVPQAQQAVQDGARNGESVLFFAHNNRFLGAIYFADRLKDSARKGVVQLKRLGFKILLLSGDNEQTCKAVARSAGIEDVVGGALPQEKEAIVCRLQAQGEKVAVVGDGINDAPALMRANIGMTLGGGTDIAAQSAGIILLKDDICAVAVAVSLARAVMRNIKQNLFWAFFYNVLGIPLAAGVFYKAFGWRLNPVFAAAAMSLSSVCVVSNALRLRFFKPDFSTKETSDMQKILTIEGMMCGHCAAHVERALAALGAAVKVDLATKTAVVTAGVEIPDEALKEAVRNAGYEVTAIQ